MKAIKLGLSVIIVGVVVALTYHFFEGAVRHGLDLVWNDWFDTAAKRWLVVPLCLAGSLIFFGTQHALDPGSEKHEAHGLGEAPSPTLENFGKVLFIGFLSLVAGASLGPEAVLVPACMIAGGLIGTHIFREERMVKLLSMAGFIALFAAFFHSFLAGMVGLLLVKKQTKLRLSPIILLAAVIASASTYFTLKLLDANAYLRLPAYSWRISLRELFLLAVLVAAGYVAIMGLGGLHRVFTFMKQWLAGRPWYVHALGAGAGLSILYLLGGSLVEFTGNESIVPMFHQAASLGFVGLVWVLVIKLAAIGWSKTLGYRGGMIFPTVFAASVLIAIAQTVFFDINFIYGLVAVLIGAFAADRKAKILL